VTISNALLNNFQYVINMGLAIGDVIEVSRRGDVIPHVEGVIEKGYTCPECGFKGTLEEQEKHHADI
jgi:NAD-dependent DNA ligase